MKIRLYLAMVFTFLLAVGSTQTLMSAQRTPEIPDATLKAVAAAKARRDGCRRP